MTAYPVPPHACDCHMHVFGDPTLYPPAAVRAYNPREMSFDLYAREAARIGFSRVVIVQPSAYVTDNRCTLDALRSRPATTRAIAVINDATPETDLAEMARLGVRGVRLNLVSNATPAPDAAIAELQSAAARVARYGWHVQIFATPSLITALAPTIRALPVPVVIDHMGLEATPALLGLLADGKIWVKLSGANRVSRQGGDFRDALPVMRALIAANPANLVWGTDWPHIGPHVPGELHDVVYMGHDHMHLLGLLAEAAGNAGTFAAILAGNAARLYGFPDVLP